MVVCSDNVATSICYAELAQRQIFFFQPFLYLASHCFKCSSNIILFIPCRFFLFSVFFVIFLDFTRNHTNPNMCSLHTFLVALRLHPGRHSIAVVEYAMGLWFLYTPRSHLFAGTKAPFIFKTSSQTSYSFAISCFSVIDLLWRKCLHISGLHKIPSLIRDSDCKTIKTSRSSVMQ